MTFLKLLEIDGVPGTLIVSKPKKPGDPVEVSVVSGVELAYGSRYEKGR